MNEKIFHLSLAILLMVWGLVVAGFAIDPGLRSFADDSMSYLVMALYLSPWQEAGPAIIDAWPREQYPPLFAWLLAATGAVHNLAIAHGLVVVTGVFAAGAMALFVRRATSSAGLALGVTVLFLVSPYGWVHHTRILSEGLYIGLVAVSFLLARHAFDNNRRWQVHAVLGFVMGLVVLTRSLGMALVLAYGVLALYAYYRGRLAFRAPVIAGSVFSLLVLPWLLLRPDGSEERYGKSFHEVGVLFAEGRWWDIIAPQLHVLDRSWMGMWSIYWEEGVNLGFVVLVLSLVLVAVGLLSGVFKGRLHAWYAMIYLLVLLVWPFPGQMTRFVYAVMPVLLLLMAEGVVFMAVRVGLAHRSLHLAGLASLLLISVSAPALGFIQGRFDFPLRQMDYPRISEFYWELDPQKARQKAAVQLHMFDDMRALQKDVPADAVILTLEPGFVALLAQRRARRLPFDDFSAQGLRRIQTSGADYIYLPRMHPRNTRDGADAMVMLPPLRSIADMVWGHLSVEDGKPVSALLKIRKDEAAVPFAPQLLRR